MNKMVSWLAVVYCIGALVPCASGQIVKVVRGVKQASALDVLGHRFAAGEQAALNLRSAERAAKLAALRVPRVQTPHKPGDFNTYIAHSISPTESSLLKPRLLGAPPSVLNDAVRQYERFFADFAEMRREVDGVLGGMLLDKVDLQRELHPVQLGYYAQCVEGLGARLRNLRLVPFPEDPALKEAQAYIEFAAGKFNKFYMPELIPTQAAVRPFVREEFAMDYDFLDESAHVGEWRALPENVRLAVLNDNPEILSRYKQWELDEYFPKGWKVFTYDNVQDLLQTVNAGQKFDLIISDVNVPGGGGYYFVNRLRQKDAVTPVIGCSMYPTRNQIKPENLHAIGFDGYMCGEDMFDTPDGFSMWVYYVKNYYYYKNKGNWPR